MKINKLEKTILLAVSGILLFTAGGNPVVQDKVQSIKNYIEIPMSHADDNNTFDLHKRVTVKQFTVNMGEVTNDVSTYSTLNKKLSKRTSNYLQSINNLSDYRVHTARITTEPSGDNDFDASETATLTFIRK